MITIIQRDTACMTGFIEMFFSASLSICVPIQNNPTIRHPLLIDLRKEVTSTAKENK